MQSALKPALCPDAAAARPEAPLTGSARPAPSAAVASDSGSETVFLTGRTGAQAAVHVGIGGDYGRRLAGLRVQVGRVGGGGNGFAVIFGIGQPHGASVGRGLEQFGQSIAAHDNAGQIGRFGEVVAVGLGLYL